MNGGVSKKHFVGGGGTFYYFLFRGIISLPRDGNRLDNNKKGKVVAAGYNQKPNQLECFCLFFRLLFTIIPI